MEKEILAQAIEIYSGIEIFMPSVTRYTVGPKFAKIVYDKELGMWKVFSRKSNRVGLIGNANIKGVILIEGGDGKPAETPAQTTRRQRVPVAPGTA